MQTRNPLAYFKFGQQFHRFQVCSEESRVSQIISSAAGIVDFLSAEGLHVSRRVYEKTIASLIDDLKNCKEEKVPQGLAEEIQKQTKVLFQTVSAEALDQNVYIISEKKYSTKKLSDEVSSLFAEDVFDDLPEIARFDFKEACKCILFERSTAAAFHLLRGTEDAIKSLYVRLSGNGATPGRGTWGDYESALKNLPNKPSEALIAQLSHIRKSFRNPTQHPEMRYDIQEAQDLLNLCIDVVNRIAKVV